MSSQSSVWFRLGCLLLIFALPLALVWGAVSPSNFDKWLDHPLLCLAAFMSIGIAVCFWGIGWLDRLHFEPGRWKRDKIRVRKWGAAFVALAYLALAGNEARDLQRGHLDAHSAHSARVMVAVNLAAAAFWLLNGLLNGPKPKPIDKPVGSQPPSFD